MSATYQAILVITGFIIVAIITTLGIGMWLNNRPEHYYQAWQNGYLEITRLDLVERQKAVSNAIKSKDSLQQLNLEHYPWPQKYQPIDCTINIKPNQTTNITGHCQQGQLTILPIEPALPSRPLEQGLEIPCPEKGTFIIQRENQGLAFYQIEHKTCKPINNITINYQLP